MQNRRRTLALLPINNPDANRIHVELYFNKGGINYANYKDEERGYYLSIRPEFYEEKGHFSTTMYKGYSGVKQLIEPAKRFGKAKLDKMDIEQDTIDRLVNYVIEKNGLSTDKKLAA